MGQHHTATEPFDPEFDIPYTLHPDGNVTDSSVNYLPPVMVDDPEGGDIVIDSAEWSALKGYTGQHGYHGAIMHPSEQWGQWAIDALKEAGDSMGPDYRGAPVTFAVVEAMDEDGSYPDGDAIGWVVIYRVERAA